MGETDINSVMGTYLAPIIVIILFKTGKDRSRCFEDIISMVWDSQNYTFGVEQTDTMAIDLNIGEIIKIWFLFQNTRT